MGRRPCSSKDEELNRGAWTAEEDRILLDYVATHGKGRWQNISKKAGLKRCGKSCRLRWLNYLRPDIKRGNISPDEEELIIRLHKLLGNRWSLIARRLPGRTDNEIKNYWNTILGKREQNNHLKLGSPKQRLCYPDQSEGRASPEPKQNKDTSGNICDTVQPSLCKTKPSMSPAAFWAAALRCSEVAINQRPQLFFQQDEHQNHCFDGDILANDVEGNLSVAEDPLMNFDFGDLCLSDLLNSDLTGSNDSSSPSNSTSVFSEEPMLQDRNLIADSHQADDVGAPNHIPLSSAAPKSNGHKVEQEYIRERENVSNSIHTRLDKYETSTNEDKEHCTHLCPVRLFSDWPTSRD